jgi:hypothetical protein
VSLVIRVRQATDMLAAEVALHTIGKPDQDLSLSPPLSPSGFTVSQSLSDIIHSLSKLVEIADDFSKVVWPKIVAEYLLNSPSDTPIRLRSLEDSFAGISRKYTSILNDINLTTSAR